MKYAVTDYDGCEYITAGKRYEVINSDENDIVFSIIDDTGHKMVCLMKRNSNFNWRIEMNNDIEQQGNDFEVKYDEPNDYLHIDSDDLDAAKALDFIEGYFIDSTGGKKDCVNNWIQTIRASLQKQPEMSKSDVTRSDIELRDYFAAMMISGNMGAFHGSDVTDYKEMAHDAYMLADAMMEARK